MNVDVSRLKEEPGAQLAVSARAAVPWDDRGGDLVSFGPVEVDLSLVNTGSEILATGTVRAVATLRCARCLVAFTSEREVPFRQAYREAPGDGPAGPAPGGVKEDGEEEGEEVFAFSGDTIDLGEAIRQHLWLDLPMKPLCRTDCRGLCPECGTDRNVAACDCAPGDADPRLAGLKEFFRLRGER